MEHSLGVRNEQWCDENSKEIFFTIFWALFTIEYFFPNNTGFLDFADLLEHGRRLQKDISVFLESKPQEGQKPGEFLDSWAAFMCVSSF